MVKNATEIFEQIMIFDHINRKNKTEQSHFLRQTFFVQESNVLIINVYCNAR